MKKWKCTVCGYIHHGEEPPEKCPVCGADKSLFVLLQENAGLTDEPAKEAEKTPGSNGDAPSDRHSTRRERIGDMLTRLHGHPIAVHIPNGVLPISVFFTFVALLLKSEGLAIAARYNTIMVVLAMPVVIGTGWIDWKNRFGGRMTKVFRIKMICAGIVFLLSLVSAVWWLVQPNLYAYGFSRNLFFLLISLVNLGAAGLAGWYGGKLVFKNQDRS